MSGRIGNNRKQKPAEEQEKRDPETLIKIFPLKQNQYKNLFMNSNVITMEGRNEDGFTVSLNVSRLNMIRLPEVVLASREDNVIGRTVQLEMDREKEGPFEICINRSGGRKETRIYCNTAEKLYADVKNLLSDEESHWILLESGNMENPDKRVLINMAGLSEMRTAPGKPRPQPRIYFDFADGKRAFVQAADVDDHREDVKNLVESGDLKDSFLFNLLDSYDGSETTDPTFEETGTTVEHSEIHGEKEPEEVADAAT